MQQRKYNMNEIMQLNENTMKVLENYATIQENIVFNQGNVIKTMATPRNILAVAELDQSFPREFGIYNLKEFLNVMSLVDKPKLTFSEEYVSVNDENGLVGVKYFYASPQTLISPEQDINMPESEVKFTLDQTTLRRIRAAAGVLNHEKMLIAPNGPGEVLLTVVDPTDKTSNSFQCSVPADHQNVKFEFVMTISNLKVVDGDYDVDISKRLLSRFTNKGKSVTYFIALERSSTYGE